jgi:hypothetical protein
VKVAELTLNGNESEIVMLIKSATREITDIRKDNQSSDIEIRRLQAATRKKLNRIRENLRHVETAR